jgi:hypothetical protein
MLEIHPEFCERVFGRKLAIMNDASPMIAGKALAQGPGALAGLTPLGRSYANMASGIAADRNPVPRC